MINVTNKFLQLEIKKSISMTFRRTQRYLDDTNDSSCDSGKLNVGICHIYYIHWNVRYCHYHYSALLQFNPKKKKNITHYRLAFQGVFWVEAILLSVSRKKKKQKKKKDQYKQKHILEIANRIFTNLTNPISHKDDILEYTFYP